MQVLSTAAQARLHAYLTRATFGLTGEQKQAVWDELEEHVLTRADHLCAFGTPYPEALSQALAELGPPQTVSAEMLKVYLMPKIMILTLLAAVGIGGVVVADNAQRISSQHEVIHIHTQNSLCGASAKVRKRSLYRNLKSNTPVSLILQGRPTIEKSAALNMLNAAGLHGSSKTRTEDGERMEDVLIVRKGSSNKYAIYDYLYSGESIYYNLSSIIDAIAKERPETLFLSTSPLTLRFNNHQFVIEARDNEVNALFSWLILDKLPNIFSDSVVYSLSGEADTVDSMYLTSKNTYKTFVPEQEGERIMLIVYTESGYCVDTSTVKQGGQIVFRDDYSLHQFVNSFSEVRTLPQNFGNALLIRMTHTPLNDLASGIVQPLP